MPLHMAVTSDHIETVQALLTELRTVPAATRHAPHPDNGWTPLHLAAYGGSAQMVQMLLDADAPVTCTNIEK